MPIPSPLPLEDFERAIQADPEALGVFYFGSLGRGAASRHSDLDIFVWVADSVDLTKPDKLVELLKLFGEIHVLEAEGSKGFVGPGWVQVDFEFGHRENLAPHYRYAGATVIKDTDGVLARMAAECAPEQIVETAESAAGVFHGAIEDQLFNARHNARGSVWSAMGGISYWCSLTYELIGRLRGRRTYGFRYVEDLLTPEEQVLIAAAWPREPTREENRRAARALWTWTKYVWREAERVIGQPLPIDLDEQGMLAAIDRMYT
jgi:predicted nucleotidyltransferase